MKKKISLVYCVFLWTQNYSQQHWLYKDANQQKLWTHVDLTCSKSLLFSIKMHNGVMKNI